MPLPKPGHESPAIVLRSGSGKYLGSAPTGLADGRPSQTLKRAGLYQALHEEAARRGVLIEHGKRLVDAKQTGDAVRAVFTDGSQATGDLLIGCRRRSARDSGPRACICRARLSSVSMTPRPAAAGWRG